MATCAYEVTRALAASGVEVRLIAPEVPGAEAFDRAAPFETLRVPMSTDSVRSIPRLAGAYRREVERFRPDAVLSYLWLPGAVAQWLGASRVPRYCFVHGVELLESRRTLRKAARATLTPLKNALLSGMDGLFAVSHFTRDLAVGQCGVDEARAHVVFNGVDTRRLTPGPADPMFIERFGLRGKRVLLSLSRLDPHKGIDHGIGAFARIAPRFPDAAYVVAGAGPDLERLRKIAADRGVSGSVIFAGALQAEELQTAYRSAELFVGLSREDLARPAVEGFGIVFLEAAACAKPSIAGRGGGVADAVEDGVTGWLVNPMDEGAIADAMAWALDHPDEVARRGKSARARAERFTWDEVSRLVRGVILRGGA